MAVKYCSAACQRAHRPQHKRECKKRAAELHDEALFKQPPLNEECPICFLTLPSLHTGSKYKSCCGKIVCSGCIRAVQMVDGDAKCPFCRVPTPVSDEEIIARLEKRVEVDDANAIHNLGCCYNDGDGIPQDQAKALDHWHQAGELGNAKAYYNVGASYFYGKAIKRDMKKAKHYWELAAIGGYVSARYNLGVVEMNDGNLNRALKHCMIAVGCGDGDSLEQIRTFYMNGYATKDDYTKALREYQKYIDGIKSSQRDEAAAFNSDMYRYY